MRPEGCLRTIWLGLLTVAAIAACAGRAADLTAVGNDSESHFLVHCQPGGCSDGLSCLFGVCTALCADDAECRSWAGGAVCRPAGGVAEGSNGEQSVCDVECSQDGDCLALGRDFSCNSGVCRADGSLLSSSFSRACRDDSECTAGLSCLGNTCTQPCEVATDCSIPGSICEYYLASIDGAPRGYCLHVCSESFDASAAEHRECAFLGEGGRCTQGVCRETLGGQCGDVGQSGAEWACYEDIAADVFRARHALLLDEGLCVPSRDARIGDVSYRRCPDTLCADGSSGCDVRGLVLESQPLTPEEQSQSSLASSPTVLVAAHAEAQLREPLRLRFDLLDPVERCEYSVSARFWNIQLFDGYGYRSPFLVEQQQQATVERSFDPSLQAAEEGLWQVTHQIALGHTDSSSSGAIIEDSEADVQIVSGGERCGLILDHVGVVARDSLTDAVNEALQRWANGVEDTLECTRCGQVDCELACRYR